MGVVWSAVHAQTGRDFAIKFLHPLVAAASDDARERFLQEARASAKVNHPSIIDVLDVGEQEDGSLYLVMELLEGMNLGDALRAEPRFNARELLIIMAGAARALGAAHAVGVVHRDVKPPNIFLHRDRSTGVVRTKVLDFGVSKLLADADGVATQTGSLLGSPRYMAPEQAISASAADGRSDVWSLGVILYEALTGLFPHDGDSSNSLVIAIATRPPKPIHAVAPSLPLAVRLLVDDCLQPVEQRLESADILADRIMTALATEDLKSIALARPAAAKNTVARPESFVISLSGGVPGLTTSASRASAAHLALQAPPEPDPAMATPSATDTIIMRAIGDTPPARAPAWPPREAPPPEGSPLAEPSLRTPPDPTQSVSSLNVVRDESLAFAPPSLPPSLWAANRSILISLGAVAAVIVSLILFVALKSSRTPRGPDAAALLPTPSARGPVTATGETAATKASPASAGASTAPTQATASASASAAASASAYGSSRVKPGPMPKARPGPTNDPLKTPGF